MFLIKYLYIGIFFLVFKIKVNINVYWVFIVAITVCIFCMNIYFRLKFCSLNLIIINFSLLIS